ncbi:ATP-dependent translocase ABCB1-like [Panulirus ornatus]|uniref:ATP-dependent translocase ABCB1-like n=1 Tax=Panulirus ornatus TaxID=150431 RepID=UPI003A8C6E8D
MVAKSTGDASVNGTKETGMELKMNTGGRDTRIDMQLSDGDDNKKNDGKKKKAKEKGVNDKEEKKENQLPPVPVFQVFRYASSCEKWSMITGILAAVLAGICMPALFILFGDVTNAFVYNDMRNSINNETNLTSLVSQYPQLVNQYPYWENQTLEEIEDDLMSFLGVDDFFQEVVRFGVGTIIIGAVQMVMGYILVTSMNYAAEGQVYRLRGLFLQSILRQEIGWFDTHQTNDFASRVTEDLNKLQEGIGEKVGMFLFFMTIFLASLINAFVHGWELTLIILSVFPLLGITTGVIAKVQSNLTSVEMKEYARAGSIAEEVISAIRTVVAFGGEDREVQRYEENLVHAKKAGVKRGLVTGIGLGLMWLIIYAAYSLAFYYGIGLILESRQGRGSYDPSNLIIVFFSVLMGAMNVGQAAPYLEAFNVARGAAASIFDIVERKSAIDPTSSDGESLATVKGVIELEDVHFNYPSRPDVKVLQGVSLKVDCGQTIALVGSSGCGKSTCIQLIQRFYDPISGNIRLDGKALHSFNLGWLRDQIGVVGQEPVLFATTIAENIRYGRDGVSMADIQAAAKEANAHNFIMKLPKQYETNVGERGAQMSGGQKQRIAIARALVRQPHILLLDEATSALDNQSEAVVQQALDKARQGRTTIIVAHRLSTIKSADKIFVFNKGKIVEVGTHGELMKLQSLYYNLVTAQVTPAELQNTNEDKQLPSSEQLEACDTDSVAEITQDIVEDLTSMTPVALQHSLPLRQSLQRRRSSSSRNKKEKDKGDDDIAPPVSTFKILKMNASEWPYIVSGVVGAAIQGTCVPLYAVLFGEVLGTLAVVEETEARKEANFYALLFLMIGIVAAVSMFMQSFMFSLSGEILTARLRKLTFAAMLRQEMAWFDDEKNSVGALCSRLSGDASAVQGATGSRVGTIVQAITTLGVSIIMALYFDWRLGLVSFPFVPFVLFAVYLQSKILMGQSITESKILQDAGAAFGFAQAMPFYAYAVTLLYGGYLVDVGAIGFANVFKVAEALILGTMMVGQAVAFAPNYSKAKVAASHIFSMLQRHPAIETSPGVGLRLSGPVTNVELHDVHFSYPTRPDVPILMGLGVRVDQGQTLALVGSSGCGKSTIIGLLERFYDTQKGKVCINGEDVQALNVGWVRNQLSLVSQEPVLFDRTIAENIAYGDNCRQVGRNEIVAAAKQANIHAFIESLPNGYDTRAGAKGTQLSGGQKQRIAIARALIRNPSVLMLDEATSALDTESEKVVQEALEHAQEGRTSIVIAHRLSTIQGANTIAVVQGGQVVEAGTHAQLIEKKGHYFSLYQTNQ